ncbi:MAG: SLC13 family permease [Cellvibrionaceae bacterium]|nr:SLC13 family permease [Cellvibrionaceae bacterium]
MSKFLLSFSPARYVFWLAPIIAAGMMVFGPPDSLQQPAWLVAACMLIMALWWMTEVVPVAVTALLPILLFPLMGVSDLKTTTANYAHPIIYLFLGGFLLAQAIEKWNLHRRIALTILAAAGGNARSLMGGFMLTSALLSMWISNTATTMMLLPVGLAIIAVIGETVTHISEREHQHFQKALLLSIAYSATLGGVATLIGTPPNAFMAAFIAEQYNIDIAFSSWILVGLPVTLIMLPLVWWYLSKFAFPFNFQTSEHTRRTLTAMKDELGPIAREEKIIAVVFIITALSWAARPVLDNYITSLSDPGIAIAAGLAMFFIPSAKPGAKPSTLLTWSDTKNLPWGILILFGGGLALANAVSSSGLAAAIGSAIAHLSALNLAVLVVMVTTLVVFLTEMTSNLATTATFLPVIAAVAMQFGLEPVVLIVPIALAASCAFMLPVATPPNAIVYSAEKLSIADMAKAGFSLNLFSIIVVSVISIAIVPLIFATLH